MIGEDLIRLLERVLGSKVPVGTVISINGVRLTPNFSIVIPADKVKISQVEIGMGPEIDLDPSSRSPIYWARASAALAALAEPVGANRFLRGKVETMVLGRQGVELIIGLPSEETM